LIDSRFVWSATLVMSAFSRAGLHLVDVDQRDGGGIGRQLLDQAGAALRPVEVAQPAVQDGPEAAQVQPARGQFHQGGDVRHAEGQRVVGQAGVGRGEVGHWGRRGGLR
jgi:hypothetical protein